MNWLVIAVIVLIVLATLAGAKRGLVKTVLSFASFFVSLVIMLFVREPVSDFVKDQTGIYAAIETSVSSFVEEKTQEIQAGQAQLTDKVIDSLNLPDVLTKSLEQSNSKAVYEPILRDGSQIWHLRLFAVLSVLLLYGFCFVL